LIPKKHYLLLWNQSIRCTFNFTIRKKAYKAYRTGHESVKLL